MRSNDSNDRDLGPRTLCQSSDPKIIFCSTSGLNKDSLALKEAAINRGDEEATADMQQDAEVVFYWDGGDYAKNGGAAWFENNRRAGVMFVILAVIACGSAVIACGSAVIACGSAAVTQFQFYGDNFADTTLLMCYYHCNQPQDNIGMALRVCVLLWMALLTLPLLAWRFLPMLKIFPPPSSPMGALDFTRASHAWTAATSSQPRSKCWSWPKREGPSTEVERPLSRLATLPSKGLTKQ